MEKMELIDACEMCGEFKIIDIIKISGEHRSCCWECEKNLLGEEE
jgi:hypothetical protein